MRLRILISPSHPKLRILAKSRSENPAVPIPVGSAAFSLRALALVEWNGESSSNAQRVQVSVENPANQGQAVSPTIPRFLEVELKSQGQP